MPQVSINFTTSFIIIASTYCREPHIGLPANKIRHRHLNLLQQIPPIVLKDSDIEHHNPLHTLIMIRRAHRLQPTATMPRRRNHRRAHIAILGRPARHRPVDAIAHILHFALHLRPAGSVRCSIRRDNVPVRRNLHEEVLVRACVERACAVAPCDEGELERGRRCVDGREDGVAGKAGICEHAGGIRARALSLLAGTSGGLGAGLRAPGDVGGEFVERNGEDAAGEVAVAFCGEVPWGGNKFLGEGEGNEGCEEN